MIKVVVFDFDDTLYNTDVWYKWADFCDKTIRQCLPHYTESEVLQFIKKYNLTNACNGNVIAEALIKETGNDTAVDILRDSLYAEAKDVKFVNNKIIENFAKYFELYIVSFSPIDFIRYYSEKHNFDLSHFKKILGNDKNQCENNKKSVFEQIIKDTNIAPQEMCVIGDNYLRDIAPAKYLGCHTIQVSKISEINNNMLKLVQKM